MSAARALVALAAAACAFAAAPALAVDFDFVPLSPVLVDTLGGLMKLRNVVRNNEPTTQVFLVQKAQALPGDWTASICVGNFCYAPFITQASKSIAAGDSIILASWIQTYTNRGSGRVVLTVTPEDAPAEAISRTLTGITEGLDVLVVDDDGGRGGEAAALAAMPPGKTVGVWPREIAAPTDADLRRFERVMWVVGGDGPGLDASDRAAITGYLEAGGKILLAGGSVAWDLCDAASANASPDACAWLAATFRAEHAGSVAGGARIVTGVATDAIGDSLAFAVGDSSAAGGAARDAVRAANGGAVFLTYDAGAGAAGVRSVPDQPATVFLPFGFETIDGDGVPATLLSRALDHLDAPTPGVATTPLFPGARMLSHPNPFAPGQAFKLRILEPGRAAITIADASGRLVRRIADASFAAGETRIAWDARDDGGRDLASGVYFARLETARHAETRKLTLVR
jgi:hypothetical protein